MKAFDWVERNLLLEILKRRNVCRKDIELIADIYSQQEAYMAKDQNNEHLIKVKRGVRQGCILPNTIQPAEMMRNTELKYGVTAYGRVR